jgi:hypothetical protein
MQQPAIQQKSAAAEAAATERYEHAKLVVNWLKLYAAAWQVAKRAAAGKKGSSSSSSNSSRVKKPAVGDEAVGKQGFG